MRRHTIPVVLACLALLAPAPPGFAQQKEMSIEQLTRRADLVVVGAVEQLSSAWNAGRTRISTTVTIRVDESLKGAAPGATITLTVPGGEADGVGELYSHAPRFRPDEQVLVFARRDAGGALRVAGGELGKITVARDERSGRLVTGTGEVLEALTTRVRRAVTTDTQR